MRFDARIPDPELRQLASLIGRRLTAISTDRWAVQIATDDFSILIIPEEIATPDNDHKCADVTRPKPAEPVDSAMETIASELGTITSVSVFSTVVVFSPSRTGKPIEINGVTIPEGVEYGPVFSHPSRPPRINSDQTVVDLDIAFELQTDANNRITVYTDGCGFFVYASVNEDPISPTIYQRTEINAA